MRTEHCCSANSCKVSLLSSSPPHLPPRRGGGVRGQAAVRVGPPRLGAVLAQRTHAVEGASAARSTEGTTVVRIRFQRKERARAVDVALGSGSGERATVYVGAALDEGLDPGRLLLLKQLPSQRSPLLVRGMSSSYEFRAGSQHLQRNLGQPYERCLYLRSSVPL